MPILEQILSAARTVQSELETLLGNKAAQVAPKLAQLIGEVEAGQTDSLDREKFLTEYDATKDRMIVLRTNYAELLHQPQTLVKASYNPLAGNQQIAAAQKYTCPQCNYIWYRRDVGQDIPKCIGNKVTLTLAYIKLAVVNTKFLQGLSGKLAERWVANLLTPAFIFWAGGFVTSILKFGWEDIATTLNQLSQPQQIALLIFTLLLVTTSASVIERFDFVTLRLLEGYYHPRWLRRPLVKRQQKNQTKNEEKWQKLYAKKDTEGLTPDEEEDLAQLEAKLKRIPPIASKLMPTALGNILRAAEMCPYNKYGLDAILCWPRLWLLLPEQVRNDLGEARSELNTAVRVLLWSFLFCVWSIWTIWALTIGLFSALFVYRWALDAAGTYGDLLEATFDLYRFDLYRSLQWPLPTSTEEEKVLAARLNTYWARGY